MVSIHSWLDNFPDLVQATWQAPQLTGHDGMVPGTGYKQEGWNSNDCVEAEEETKAMERHMEESRQKTVHCAHRAPVHRAQ